MHRTRLALRVSINKWHKLARGVSRDFVQGCELCGLDDELDPREECSACVIFHLTGKRQCGGTPWKAWNNYWKTRINKTRTGDTPKAKRLAQAELDFLREVLRVVERFSA